MKKLLTFLTLFLMLGGVASAEIIELKNCINTSFDKSKNSELKLNKDYWEEHKIKIDTKNKIITETVIMSDEFSKKNNLSKIDQSTYYVQFFEDPYVKGYRNFKTDNKVYRIEVDINLVTKKVIFISNLSNRLRFDYICE